MRMRSICQWSDADGASGNAEVAGLMRWSPSKARGQKGEHVSVMYWKIVVQIGSQGKDVFRYRATHWSVAEAIEDVRKEYGGEPYYDGMDFA